MAQYRTGTATFTNGSQVVTGTGTSWLSSVSDGNWIVRRGSSSITYQAYEIGSVDSDTQITLTDSYAGDTATDADYIIQVDFLANGAPRLNNGDVNPAAIMNRHLGKTVKSDDIGTAAYLDQDSLPLTLDSIEDISGLSGYADGQKFDITGYYSGTTVGGGTFVKATGRHDGVIYFDPSRVSEIGTSAYYVDSGVDAVCVMRVWNGVGLTPDDAGAFRDGSDSLYAFRALISYFNDRGRGNILGTETQYRVSSYFGWADNVTAIGLNIKKLSGMDDDRMIYHVAADFDSGVSNIKFFRCNFEGTWDETHREAGSNGLLTFKYCKDIEYHGCTFKYARFISSNINFCDSVKYIGCDFKYGIRDMAQAWNTPDVIIQGCTFEGNDDDVISISTAGMEQDPIRNSCIIANNIFKDTGGISTQLAKTMIIDGNIFERCKGGFNIKLSGSNYAETYENSPQSCTISNNHMMNTVDRAVSEDSGTPTQNLRLGIFLDGIVSSAGSETAAPGYPDPTTGAPVAPYNYFYNQDDATVRPSTFIKIFRNTVSRQLPAVTNYSDWGFGKVFTRFSTDTFASDGFTDPEVTDTMMQCLPLQIRGPLADSEISNNIFAGGTTNSIVFRQVEGESVYDSDLRNVTVSNNKLKDATSVVIDISAYDGTYQDITLKDNEIDGDPYFRSSGRATSSGAYTGGWSSQTSCVGIGINSVSGIKIYRNEFKNVSLPIRHGTVSNTTRRRGNVLHSQPIAIGYDSGNLGVGTIPSDNQYEYEIIYTDCDPVSTSYGSILSQTNASDVGNPSSGFYTEGFILPLREATSVTYNSVSQTVFAYLRLTTGTSHVIGTDWQPLYAEI